MSIAIRVVLIAASLLSAGFMLYRIRCEKVQIEYSIFWIVFSFILLLLSVFPQAAYFISRALGFQSPINFVFLAVISLLAFRLFTMSVKMSQLENKLTRMAQKIALDEREHEQE